LSAYFIYTNEQREQIRKDNPELKITEVSKRIGDMWKALSDDEKKPYNVKANEAKTQYEKAVKDFVAAGGQMPERKSKKKAKSEGKSDAAKDKKAASKKKKEEEDDGEDEAEKEESEEEAEGGDDE